MALRHDHRDRPLTTARLVLATDEPPDGPPASWIYLGQEYGRLLEWEEALGSATRIPAGPLIQEAAESLRRPFLDWLGSCAEDTPAWWTSRVTERNTAYSDLFLHCCWLSVAQRSDASLIVCESPAVLTALGGPAPRRTATARVLTSRALAFLTRALGARRAARGASSPTPGARTAMLRSWVDEGCFAPDGSLRERYLPGVREWLEDRGWTVVTLPQTTRVERSPREFAEQLRRLGPAYVEPGALYRAADYAWALREAWRQRRLLDGPVKLGDLDITQLVAAELDTHAFDAGTLDALLSVRLPMRLAAKGLAVDLFIDTYENMIPEKALTTGFRRYQPSTRIVAFQHGAIYPLLLCLYMNAREASLSAAPDRIVTSGQLARNALARDGFPDDRLRVGPALRFASLREVRAGEPASPPRVLVPLPLMENAALELVTKVAAALGDDERVEVEVARHPHGPGRERFAEMLPPRFSFLDDGIRDRLSGASALVGLASTSLLEAAAAGVPTVVVGQEGALRLSPLDWYPDLAPIAYSPDEIREEAIGRATWDAKTRGEWRARTETVLAEAFAPVTDEAMAAFTDGLASDA